MSVERMISEVMSEEMYLKRLTDHDLLTAEEERGLGASVQLGRQAAALLESQAAASLNEEEQAEQRLLVESADKSREVFIRCNQRLVFSIADKYADRTFSLDRFDLAQEGNIGLMKAVERFDPDMGYKFSTYATWWVKQAILGSISDQDRTIRLPEHRLKRIQLMRKHEQILINQGNSHPSDEAVAASAGLEAEEIGELKKIDTSYVSLNQPIMEDEPGDEFGETIKNEDYESAIERVLDRVDAEHVVTFLRSVLTPREADVFMRRKVEGETHNTVGRRHGVGPRQSRNIEVKAERKIEANKNQLKLAG